MKINVRLSKSSDIPYFNDETFDHFYEQRELHDHLRKSPLPSIQPETLHHKVKRLSDDNKPIKKRKVNYRRASGNELSNSPESQQGNTDTHKDHYESVDLPKDYTGTLKPTDLHRNTSRTKQ